MIEDKEVRLDDQTRWDLYVKRIGEPKRFEDWGSRLLVYSPVVVLGIVGVVSLWLFLSGRVN